MRSSHLIFKHYKQDLNNISSRYIHYTAYSPGTTTVAQILLFYVCRCYWNKIERLKIWKIKYINIMIIISNYNQYPPECSFGAWFWYSSPFRAEETRRAWESNQIVWLWRFRGSSNTNKPCSTWATGERPPFKGNINKSRFLSQITEQPFTSNRFWITPLNLNCSCLKDSYLSEIQNEQLIRVRNCGCIVPVPLQYIPGSHNEHCSSSTNPVMFP